MNFEISALMECQKLLKSAVIVNSSIRGNIRLTQASVKTF